MSVANAKLLTHLSQLSADYRDPVAAVEWRSLDVDSFWLPEAAISLYGLPEYDAFPASLRRRLSQYEFINVIHCGLWLESVFLQRLARELRPNMARTEYQYVLHQLREEAGHSLMFLRTIEASGLPLPPEAWRYPRFAAALARWAPARTELFRLAMVIGEHVPDAFNRWLRRQPELHPVVKQICTVHVVDEARHIAYARSALETRRHARGAPGNVGFRAAARILLGQLAKVFYFPPPHFYELAGLPDGAAWRHRALQSQARQGFVRARLESTKRMLRV